jgi:tRNA(Arg) A34 adenosine deaminase TadA
MDGALNLPRAINALTPDDHAAFMRRAIALSRAAGLDQRTGGCFGAVVVDSVTKRVLGEGQNRVLETKDPTAHGEIVCLRDACAKLGSPHLPKGTTVMYTSAEPCTMCESALLWGRCSFVFFAARHEDVMEHGKFDDVNFAAEIARRVEEKREMEEKKDAATKSPPPPPLLEIARPLLREEALVVWREYAARSDNVHY